MWNAKSGSPIRNASGADARPEPNDGRHHARKRWYRSMLAVSILLSAGVAYAQYGYPQYNQPPPSQYPLMDEVADRFVQRYMQSSCEQLWQKRDQPKTQREQEAVQALRNDPQMRAAFINRVAAPIANKMFECGMIP